MQCDFKEKKIAVFGANGFIGREICKHLLEEGARVVAVGKNIAQLGELDRWLNNNTSQARQISYYAADVLKISEVKLFGSQVGSLDGLVYSVGHCPPGGFDESVKNSPNELSTEDLGFELSTHVLGLQNVFKNILPVIQDHSPMVVLSSAITRVTDETCPPWLYAGHYAAAKAAQDEWIKWLRRDKLVIEKKLNIHRLSLSAVDTWFHSNSKHRPTSTLSLKRVIDEIRQALCRVCVSEPTDKLVLPSG